jgi:predicted Fe-Mo cluster-binding NifX family protein
VLLNYYQIDFQYHYISTDRLAALLVLIFIIKAGWELLSDGMRVLLDASIDPATLNNVRDIIQNEPAVKQIKSLIGRNAGRFRFLNAAITLKTHDLKKAHKIADRIEAAIIQQIGHVQQVMLHYEPCEQAQRRIAFPVLEDGHTLCSQFGETPYFAIWDIRTDTGEIQEKALLKNPYCQVGKGKGLHAAHLLMKKDIDIIGVKKKLEFSGPAYLFSDAGIDIRVVVETDAAQAVIPFLRMPIGPHSP